MRKLKFKNAVLCEYVTIGSGNRHILVNVYSSDIVIEAPGTIPMGLYVEHLPDASGSIDIAIEIRIDGTVALRLDVNAVGLRKGSVGIIAVPSIPINITHAGSFEVVAHSMNYADTAIIEKSIIIGTIPSPTA